MKRHTLILAASLTTGVGAGPGAAAHAQEPDWEKLELPDGSLWSDTTRPADVPGAARAPGLAVDGGGRVYVNNGPKLHIGSRDGTVWTTVTKPLDPAEDPGRALAAGGRTAVQWGEWRSLDGGATWDSTEPPRVPAYGILGDGTRLRALPYDRIERAEASGGWEGVHLGRTYGHITQFAALGNLVMALPLADTLLCSLNAGKTWNWGRNWPRGSELTGRTIRALDFGTRSGTPLLIAARKRADGTGNLLLRLHVYFIALDTLGGAVLPDSAITALRVRGDGSVWLGTRGQGVWTAAAGSLAFAARNGGLGNLEVTAMASDPGGGLFVLTRDGVYRARTATTASPLPRARRAPPPAAGAALRFPGLPDRLQPFPGRGQARLRVLADGRGAGGPAAGAAASAAEGTAAAPVRPAGAP